MTIDICKQFIATYKHTHDNGYNKNQNIPVLIKKVIRGSELVRNSRQTAWKIYANMQTETCKQSDQLAGRPTEIKYALGFWQPLSKSKSNRRVEQHGKCKLACLQVA